jgi:hypothetical protein
MTRALNATALGLLLLTLVTYLLHARALVTFPYDVDPGEGFDVNGAIILLKGGDLYDDPAQFPFFALNYPPVFSMAVAPVVAVFGPAISNARILSVLAGLGTAAVIAAAVSFPRPALLPSLLAGLAFLASSYVLHVTPLARVTSLMLFLGVAALACLERGSEERSSRPGWILAGLALMILGVYTKPVSLDAAAAGVAYLALRRPPGWLTATAGALGVALLLHLGLQWASGGVYGAAVYTSNAFPWDGAQALGYWRNFLETHFPLLLVGVVGLAAHLLTRWVSVWVLYFFAGLVTALSAGRWGAGESYFLPIVIACCVLGGRALSWGLPRESRLYAAGTAAFAVFALVGSAGPWPLHDLVPAWDRGFQAHALSRGPTSADLPEGSKITAFVEAGAGPSLAEAAGFVLQAKREVAGNPMLLRGLDSHQQYDTRPLVAAVEARAFSTVILLGQWYPPEVLQAIGARYREVERVDVAGNRYLLFRPRE